MIDYHVRNHIILVNEPPESLFIKIDNEIMNSQNNIVTCVLYRPPRTDESIFSEELIGDYNVNLLNVDSHPPTQIPQSYLHK